MLNLRPNSPWIAFDVIEINPFMLASEFVDESRNHNRFSVINNFRRWLGTMETPTPMGKWECSPGRRIDSIGC